jgi:RecA-family ATPase
LLVRLESGEIITPYEEAKKLLDDAPTNSKSKLISATELLNSKITEMPSLWGQFIPKGELCALTGGSDTGKSTFLRQLAFSVALKQKEFIGFPLNAEHGKVIYVSQKMEELHLPFP